MVALENLPPEILAQIFRLLDPVGIFSAAQTCVNFRRLIQPTLTRRHRVELLLQMETTEALGGPSFMFRARDNLIEPSYSSTDWDRMRWACSACLRLLPHHAFDNHSILRLASRKPAPDSPAANFTSTWEISPKQPGYGSSNAVGLSTPDLRAMRERYQVAITDHPADVPIEPTDGTDLRFYQSLGMIVFKDLHPDDFRRRSASQKQEWLDYEASRCERKLAGRARHRRKCNECRFQQKTIGPWRTGKGGTKEVPIMPSRSISYEHSIDRFFPGLEEVFDYQRPERGAPMQRNMTTESKYRSAWTLFMIRCPQCQLWKEMKCFRVGSIKYNWKLGLVDDPDDRFLNWNEETVDAQFINSLRCNTCFVEQNDIQQLGVVLINWLDSLLCYELQQLQASMMVGINLLGLDKVPSKYKEDVKAIKDGMRSINFRSILSYSDVAELKLRHAKWLRLLERMKGDLDCPEWWPKRGTGDYSVFPHWFEAWLHEFSDLEANWLWLRHCKSALEEKRHAIAEWVLTRDNSFYI